MVDVIKNKYDFALIFDVKNGNPNGDPDAANMPRIHPNTIGFVTDVCLKRKIRDYISLVKPNEKGYEIYIQSGQSLNDKNSRAYSSLDIPKSDKNPKEGSGVTEFMCSTFYDIRTFGAVMNTGVNCGQIRGPVQFNFAESVDSILPEELTITRCAVTNIKEGALSDHTMGKKWIVPYGLYVMHGYISASLADKSGFSEADLNLLWEALINMFEHDHAAARGEMSARKLIVFKHDSKFGCCPAHVLFDKIKIEKLTKDDESPKCFEDYKIGIDKNVPKGIEIIEKL